MFGLEEERLLATRSRESGIGLQSTTNYQRSINLACTTFPHQ
jgi:hypothetical protein